MDFRSGGVPQVTANPKLYETDEATRTESQVRRVLVAPFAQSTSPPKLLEYSSKTHVAAWLASMWKFLMHGGHEASRTFSDTWQWDGKTWTLVSTNGPGVLLHSMAYDPSRAITVLYGGRWATATQTNRMNANETWEWDGRVPPPGSETFGQGYQLFLADHKPNERAFF